MRELSPSGGSERYGVCDDEGRDGSARRLRAAKGRPYVRGTSMSLVPP